MLSPQCWRFPSSLCACSPKTAAPAAPRCLWGAWQGLLAQAARSSAGSRDRFESFLLCWCLGGISTMLMGTFFTWETQ